MDKTAVHRRADIVQPQMQVFRWLEEARVQVKILQIMMISISIHCSTNFSYQVVIKRPLSPPGAV